LGTQILLAIVGPVCILVGAILGAVIALKVEDKRQKGELERQKLAWRREERQRNLEPIRKLLDELSYLMWDYDIKLYAFKSYSELSKGDEAKELELKSKIAKLKSDFSGMISDLISRSASAFSRAGDDYLQGLVNVEVIVPISEGDWSENKEQMQIVISRAYRRIEELATEF
jgi:hypothetical protein